MSTDLHMPVVSRRTWGARRPRSVTMRSPGSINTIYIHWPGGPSNLRGADLHRALLVHETQADDCLLPDELQPDNALSDTYLSLDFDDDERVKAARIDTLAEECAYMRAIQNFHMNERGWSDIGYNYMGFRSGRILRGRGLRRVPAAQAHYNTSGLAICCAIGTADTVTAALRSSLLRAVRGAEVTIGHEVTAKGHRQVNQTTCPGDRLMQLVPELARQ